jgi:hypothetical protein
VRLCLRGDWGRPLMVCVVIALSSILTMQSILYDPCQCEIIPMLGFVSTKVTFDFPLKLLRTVNSRVPIYVVRFVIRLV